MTKLTVTDRVQVVFNGATTQGQILDVDGEGVISVKLLKPFETPAPADEEAPKSRRKSRKVEEPDEEAPESMVIEHVSSPRVAKADAGKSVPVWFCRTMKETLHFPQAELDVLEVMPEQ